MQFAGSKYDEADHSCELMLEIFPELTNSPDIYYVTPSKKALRRFPCTDASLQRPFPDTIQQPAHRILSDQIHRIVVEIADIGLRKISARAIALNRRLNLRSQKQQHSHSEITTQDWYKRRLRAMIEMKGYLNESEARVAIVCLALQMKQSSPSSFVSMSTSVGRNNQSSRGGVLPLSSVVSSETNDKRINHDLGSNEAESNGVENSNTVNVMNNLHNHNAIEPSQLQQQQQQQRTTNHDRMHHVSANNNRRTSERFSVKFSWTRQ
jgi:hypothetical protein